MPKELWRTSFMLVLRRVRSLPGINGAVFASDVPPEMGVSFADLQTDGGTPRTPIKFTAFEMAGPPFFQLARIGLRGRTFTSDSSSSGDASDEVILSESLAHRLWPNTDALGRRLRAGSTAPWETVVGVAHNVTAPGRRGDVFDLQLYRPITVGDFPSATILVRSDRSIDALEPTLRRIIAQVDPRLEMRHVASSEVEIAGMLAGPRFSMALLGALALAALVLSAVGLYGVIAYAVSQRTREIGVRVALGAEPRDIGRLVLRDGAVLALMGLTVGLGAAAVVGHMIESFLYGVGHTDPATYVAIAVLLAAVALIASYLPARRAMRVDPVVALSAE
jgi:putative ABC transport system permease protein